MDADVKDVERKNKTDDSRITYDLTGNRQNES